MQTIMLGSKSVLLVHCFGSIGQSGQRRSGKTRKQKAQFENWAKCLNSLGWLMGLEPTTTGITIRYPKSTNYLIFKELRVSSLEDGPC
jgi:hypothetical protein